MKLADLIRAEGIQIGLAARDKEALIDEMVDVLCRAEKVRDRAAVAKAVREREALMSTGIGQGIGIPHAKTDAVERLIAVFGRSEAGIDFQALDGKPVHLFFLLVAPEDQSGPHVKALARISRLLKHMHFREALLRAKTAEEAAAAIREEELKHF